MGKRGWRRRLHLCCDMFLPQGYLQRCTEHTKLFTSEKIELIFGNVQNIYKFQKDFLKELETRVNRDKMEDSQIGDIFVANVSWSSVVCGERGLQFFCPGSFPIVEEILFPFLLRLVFHLCIHTLQASEFTVYSEYCNNHPHAVHEMNLLQLDDQYAFFFEVSCAIYGHAMFSDLVATLLLRVCRAAGCYKTFRTYLWRGTC